MRKSSIHRIFSAVLLLSMLTFTQACAQELTLESIEQTPSSSATAPVTERTQRPEPQKQTQMAVTTRTTRSQTEAQDGQPNDLLDLANLMPAIDRHVEDLATGAGERTPPSTRTSQAEAVRLAELTPVPSRTTPSQTQQSEASVTTIRATTPPTLAQETETTLASSTPATETQTEVQTTGTTEATTPATTTEPQTTATTSTSTTTTTTAPPPTTTTTTTTTAAPTTTTTTTTVPPTTTTTTTTTTVPPTTATPVQPALSLPVQRYSYLSSLYGARIHPITGVHSFHYGLDFAAGAGTPVLSIRSGTVQVRNNPYEGQTHTSHKTGFGNYVQIKHDDGTISLYAHLRDTYVAAGQRVTAGQMIGTVGSTGASTGPHLHLEIVDYVYGDPNRSYRIDPLSSRHLGPLFN